MHRHKTFLGVLLISTMSTGLWAQSAPATAPWETLSITAVAEPATVHPGETLKFNVTIKNVSSEEQKIDVPNIVWAASTDSPQATIPGWPARGGIGPVVVFQSVSIASGESYQHTWSANVSPSASPGDLTFRVGVPLKRGGDKTWSKPLTLKVVAKDPAAKDVPNPQ